MIIQSSRVKRHSIRVSRLDQCWTMGALLMVQQQYPHVLNRQGHSEDCDPTIKGTSPVMGEGKDQMGVFCMEQWESRDMTLSQKRYILRVPLPLTPPWLFPSVSTDFYVREKMHINIKFNICPSMLMDARILLQCARRFYSFLKENQRRPDHWAIRVH